MLHGFLNLRKPAGVSSAHLLNRVKRLFGIKKNCKVGHGGILDPLAEGVLPVAFGEGCKLLFLVTEGIKEYRFSIVWGESRTTDDREGEITEISSYRPSQKEVEAILPNFLGLIGQTPPIYSALKIGGTRAYKKARAGEEVTLLPREVSVDHLLLLNHTAQESAFEVKCGKGFYVRALARDIAQALGTCGHVGQLKRIRVGKFTLSKSVSLEEMEDSWKEKNNFLDNLEKLRHKGIILPLSWVLDDILALEVDGEEERRIRCGNFIKKLDFPNVSLFILKDSKGNPLGLGESKEGIIKMRRGFCFDKD